MEARNIILAVSGAVLVGVLALLLFEVKGESTTTISAEQQARALAEYNRRHGGDGERAKPIEAAAEPRPARERPAPKAAEEPAPPRERSPRPHFEAARRDRGDPSLRDPRSSLDPAEEDGEEKNQGVVSATRLYDKGDYPGALDAALKVLEEDPRNIKMLRVVVSTKCALNEVESARAYMTQLPRRDQRQMRTRCKNWGAEL